MKVRSLGFRLVPVGAFSVPLLAGRLAAQNGSEFKFRGFDRRLYCSVKSYSSERYAVGLFLTIRDQKKFLQLQESNGKLKVKVTELDDNTRAFDFNFFVVHLESGSGLYSHYYYSCSLTGFHAYLREQYLRGLKEKETGKELEDGKRVAKSKKKDLGLQLFYRRDTFEEAVKELHEVSHFEYDILAPESMTEELQPLKSKLKLERRGVCIGSGVSGKSLFSKIKGLMPSATNAQGNAARRFRVVGKDDTGQTTPIDFVAPPDRFSEDDYDKLADGEILNLTKVQESAYITKLLKAFAKHKDLFTADLDEE